MSTKITKKLKIPPKLFPQNYRKQIPPKTQKIENRQTNLKKPQQKKIPQISTYKSKNTFSTKEQRTSEKNEKSPQEI